MDLIFETIDVKVAGHNQKKRHMKITLKKNMVNSEKQIVLREGQEVLLIPKNDRHCTVVCLLTGNEFLTKYTTVIEQPSEAEIEAMLMDFEELINENNTRNENN